jgi:NADH:ubiquinone reductase (non-electrogenic)
MELFNKIGKQNGGKAMSANDIPFGEPFVYRHLGSMASVGAYKALVDLRQSKVYIYIMGKFLFIVT